MSNLFDALSRNAKSMQQPFRPNNQFGNMINMINQFNQFRNSFQGDPQQTVQQLIDSGKMTLEQFDQLAPIAQQLQGVFFKR